MIVRISGEGQFEVPEQFVAELNDVDETLAQAVAAGDEVTFRTALTTLLDRIRTVGKALPDESLLPSDAVLPAAGSSLAEVVAVLGDEGLIPG